MVPGLENLREAVFAIVASLLIPLVLRLPFIHNTKNDTFLSNGTHSWAPTVILLSLDGFKPTYLDSGHTPVLQALREGRFYLEENHRPSVLTSDYMIPASPSLTFPNHWSIQTGLQPSSHGIIANDFHRKPHQDGRLRKDGAFYYTDPNRSWNASWWKGIPIWEHLELEEIKTANLMWPGPPITERQTVSTYFQKYEKGWSLEDRHDQIMSWLDLDSEDRPQFICGYAPDVDTVTHNLGPDPQLPEVKSALRRVDGYIHQLLTSIAERNASSIVNVVIVSDHGMTFTSNDKLVYLDKILGERLFNQILTQDGWPNAGLRFKTQEDEEEARQKLVVESERRRAMGEDAFEVLEREDLLKKWNWTLTEVVKERVANLWMVPGVGWSITTHEEMQSFNLNYGPRGNHGYDSTHPDMHAFFLARGPSIKPRPSNHINPFANVEIFNLVMNMLGIKEASNDGKKGFWKEYVG